jgi:hypothetical protein
MRARLALALALMLPLAVAAQIFGFGPSRPERDSGPDAKVSLPQYPKPDDYLPFEVSAITPFAFFVDAKSISVGEDGVVRYTLIAKSADGALNVSFEGIRCPDAKFRVYAFGGAGRSWAEIRDSKWTPIRNEPRNGQRAVLFNDYFCPSNGDIATADEGVRALKNGGNPGSKVYGY